MTEIHDRTTRRKIYAKDGSWFETRICNRCKGEGWIDAINSYHTCDRCNGEGTYDVSLHLHMQDVPVVYGAVETGTNRWGPLWEGDSYWSSVEDIQTPNSAGFPKTHVMINAPDGRMVGIFAVDIPEIIELKAHINFLQQRLALLTEQLDKLGGPEKLELLLRELERRGIK